MQAFLSKGKLRYHLDPRAGYKLIVEVDRGISLFYKSLIPRWLNVRSQGWAPHISVVRKETPPNMNKGGLHEGEVVDFIYDIGTRNDDTYWWLDAYSKRLDEIREELGFKPPVPMRPLPEGFDKRYHITLG